MTAMYSGTAYLVQRLPWPLAVIIGLAALGAIILFWDVVQNIDAMAHEGAHAFANSCMGGTTASVELKRGGAGKTYVIPAGAGIIGGAAGYLGPSACGLIAAAMIHHGQVAAVLWTGVILLLVLLWLVRGFFGVVAVASLGFFLFLVASHGPEMLQATTAYALSWLLLLSGLRTAFEHGTGNEDAEFLRDRTHLPRILWAGLWLIGSILALAVGCTLLV